LVDIWKGLQAADAAIAQSYQRQDCIAKGRAMISNAGAVCLTRYVSRGMSHKGPHAEWALKPDIAKVFLLPPRVVSHIVVLSVALHFIGNRPYILAVGQRGAGS
jgi:hypothetical protein